MNKSEKEKFWSELIYEFDKSGMSVAAFCREWNLAKHNFHYWHRKLKEQDNSEFVELTVCDDSPAVTQVNESAIRICLGVMKVEVDNDFNEQTLKRVLGCLQC